MSAPTLFCFTDEHRALRDLLREFFGGPADWSRLLGEVGADEILTGSAGTAIELAILAEEAGATLFDGPVLSTAALGELPAGSGTVAATPSLLGFGAGRLTAHRGQGGVLLDGTTEVWDARAGARVVTDAALDGEPAVVVVDAPDALRTLSGLDLSRRYGRLHAAATPATVLATGEAAVCAVRAARRRADLMISAELLGVAQHCLDGTVEYVSQRVQFGRTIGSFQAVKHRLADLLSAVELTRSAVYGAAWELAGEQSPDVETGLAVAAALSRQTAAEVTRAAIQLHGGIAITWEHWAHRYLRRAHAVIAMSGSAAAHRDRIAGICERRGA